MPEVEIVKKFRGVSLAIIVLSAVSLLGASSSSAQWVQPTPEELSMTSQPEVPGASAVYLFREEITEDDLHMWSKYERIKVLTEKGKDLANVELGQYEADGGFGFTVSDIQGRTIHPDGTVIPFTGKPYQKVVEKGQGYKVQAKVFTLPDVEVGSIIEYRYKLRYDDNRFFVPSWFVQSQLYTRKAHYMWKPTNRPLVNRNERGEQVVSTIAWTPILPKGFEIKQTKVPGGGTFNDAKIMLELDVHDIPPVPEEEYMPPTKSFTYRVLFYYSAYRTMDEFWKNEGKSWSKMSDKFIGPGPKVKQAVAGLLTPAENTDEAKLKKIYAEVMKLENTRYTRNQSAAENKAHGMGEAKTTDDILEAKRGTDDQLTELFVAMARAAGMKAYLMAVTSRDHNIFFPNFLNFGQLNDDIAIVVVNGKEQFFDPGERYCPYGHLAWPHTFASGLRQSDAGAVLAAAPPEPYTNSRTARVGNLTLDEHGEASGEVKFTWIGAPALNWRQRALRGDETSLREELKSAIQRLLPGGMDVKVAAISNLEDYEKPLMATFDVKGAIGSPTGKRLLIPGDIFLANTKPRFPHEKREVPVYFDYAYMTQDAVRVTFPKGFAVESVPTSESVPFEKFAVMQYKSEAAANSITVRRDMYMGELMFKIDEYAGLRSFYSKVETKDLEPAVLKVVAQEGKQGN